MAQARKTRIAVPQVRIERNYRDSQGINRDTLATRFRKEVLPSVALVDWIEEGRGCMSVRKRSWTTGQGLTKEAWVVDYVDVGGRRRLKTFQRKKEADAYSATTSVEVRQGTHIADSASATVREAGQLWLNRVKAASLERSTIASYTQQLAYHIIPFIGSRRLSQLHPPAAVCRLSFRPAVAAKT
jgi:hypothetical protein